MIPIHLTYQCCYEDQILKTVSSLHSLNMDLTFIHSFIFFKFIISRNIFKPILCQVLFQKLKIDSFTNQYLLRSTYYVPDTFPKRLS